MISTVFRRVADRLLAADPGLARFVTALRATLATLLTAAVSIALAVHYAAPPVAAGPAILFSMIAPLFLRDHTARNWLLSLLCLYVVAVTSFAVAATLAPMPVVADLAFVALVFTGMLVQACGPRALGSALIGLVCFYLGLYLHPAPAETALMLALSTVGPCVVVCTVRLLVPQRRAAALQLAIRTVTLRARAVLQAAHRDSAAQAALSSMNEAAIAFEERLALLVSDHADNLRGSLVHLEIAAGQFVFARTDRAAREQDFRAAIAALEAIPAQVSGSKPTVAAVPAERLRATLQRWRASLMWLPATRTAIAAAIAMFAGHSLSPERWFWAVITVFVVFLGTRSQGDTLYRGAQRIAGTLAGALVSTLLVTSLHGQPVALAGAMLLCVFGWAYFILSAYGPGVFFITVLVSLVYGELGFAIEPLVQLRIEEVTIGCLASLVAAFIVKPLDTNRHIEARFVGVVDALIDAMAAVASMQGEGARRAATTSRALDRRWHEFRIALRPQRVLALEPRYEMIAGALLCCIHDARRLIREQTDARDIPERGHAPHGESPVAPLIARLDAIRQRYVREPVSASSRPAAFAAVESTGTLASLDGAITLLAQRIAESDSGKHAWRSLWRRQNG
ncbi:FUSC family protein [Paraburkholderia sp. C35]|uniref:FUSC family protein n=1 Tax=Paraburkholderia sp. C35 TaxID=2126993 RepID=UPI000D6A03EE|nr:FUSC family protein [Paraburkholderia sp. C35]